MNVLGVILAAGEGSRLGRPKALVELEGETFLSRVAAAMRDGGCREVVAVVGGTHAAVTRAEAERDRLRVVENPDPSDGPISSIRCAVVDGSEVDAYLIHPVDIPAVTSGDVRALRDAVEASPGSTAAIPQVAGRGAHPVLIVSSERQAILEARTLRDVLAASTRVVRVPRDNPWLRFDVDTPEDLAELRRHFPRHRNHG